MRRVLIGLAFGAMLAFTSFAHAQGVQTGTITGTVQSSDGLPLPGVTVTTTSPVLQGQRATVSDVNGVYFVKGLPPGAYTVTFELTSFRTSKEDNVQLTVGSTAQVNQTMAIAAVVESINVTATA